MVLVGMRALIIVKSGRDTGQEGERERERERGSMSRDTPRLGIPILSVIPPPHERAIARVFYSHGEDFLLRFSVLRRCSGWICLFGIEERRVMSACVYEEGRIGQTYEEIRAKFAFSLIKHFQERAI
jgi:hypothetical protein